MQNTEQKNIKEDVKEEKFCNLKQNAITNFLARFSTKNKKKEFKRNNNIFYDSYGKSEITISYDLDKYPEGAPNFYVGCQKLQRYIMCSFTSKDSNIVVFSVKDLLNTLGLKDCKRSRTDIRNNLQILKDTHVDCTLRRKVGKKYVSDSVSFDVIDDWNWKKGYVTVEISQELIDSIKQCGGLIQYPLSNFELSNKHIINFAINDRIAELLSGKQNAVISCEKMYKCALSAGLKSYEYISERDERKGFSSAIVRPIEKALEAGKFYTWEYRNSDKHLRFNDWLNDYIEITAAYNNSDTNKGGE